MKSSNGNFSPFFALKGGQATVEYILLLCVVIAIALSVGRPLGKYLTQFSGALVGPAGYYACLTRKGLLPGDPKISSECPGLLAAAQGHLTSISTGAGFPSSGPGGSGSSGGSGSASSDSNSSGSSSDSSDSDSSGSGSDGSDSSKFSAGENSKKGNRNRRASRHKAKRGGPSSSLAGSDAEESGESGALDSSFSAHSSNSEKSGSQNRRKKARHRAGGKGVSASSFNKKTGYGRKRRFQAAELGEGYLGEIRHGAGQPEKAQPVFRANSSSAGGAGEGLGPEAKKSRAVSGGSSDQDTKLEEENSGFQLAGFLKYLMLAVIIIIIFIVVFSQIMEYQGKD